MIDEQRQKFNARDLRYHKPTEKQLTSLQRYPIYIILDDVLDTYNIGAIFRLADAVAAKEVIICGRSETPPNIKIHRAAIGTEEWIPWSYQSTAVTAIKELREKVTSINVLAIELNEKSVDYDKLNYRFPLGLVVGNESHGISPAVREEVNGMIEIPMWGFNKSLNVMVSLAIVLWQVMEK